MSIGVLWSPMIFDDFLWFSMIFVIFWVFFSFLRFCNLRPISKEFPSVFNICEFLRFLSFCNLSGFVDFRRFSSSFLVVLLFFAVFGVFEFFGDFCDFSKKDLFFWKKGASFSLFWKDDFGDFDDFWQNNNNFTLNRHTMLLHHRPFKGWEVLEVGAEATFWSLFGHFLGPFLGPFLGTFWVTFWSVFRVFDH